MKNMNNRKRVSFGSKGSMVETWIIEDFQEPETDGQIYRNLVNKSSECRESSQLSVTKADCDREVSYTDRTSPKTKAEKVSFCDNEISSQPNEISGRQRQPSPTTYSEVIILDSLPPGHWPIKRSASLESRDNPFMPGSDLCKEAEEILQKATIIRDRFILRDETDGTPEEEVTSETKLELHSPGNGKDCSVVEETLLPQTSASVNAAPNAKARQNGKIDDTVSPTTVKVEVGGGQSDGLMVIGDNKDKKKQKKCCSVM
ncbi:uncharacterized protein LOC110445208 isoform X8 [Mizuhopecten yessoensis]|uniref:uncharacterized protein LOC110445208 isoform X8 n=1 Tax=Mizuhopecten yessoensis TaxID=6573 RepID=UPI000B457ADF|nr:uncharacterized protein LOC110445208 isoform X8 [Mizuhopecten yessoensis]